MLSTKKKAAVDVDRRTSCLFLLVDVNQCTFLLVKVDGNYFLIYLATFFTIQLVMKSVVNVNHCTFLGRHWPSFSFIASWHRPSCSFISGWCWSTLLTSILQPSSSRPNRDILLNRHQQNLCVISCLKLVKRNSLPNWEYLFTNWFLLVLLMFLPLTLSVPLSNLSLSLSFIISLSLSIYSWLSWSDTARGSCISLVTVGPTIV